MQIPGIASIANLLGKDLIEKVERIKAETETLKAQSAQDAAAIRKAFDTVELTPSAVAALNGNSTPSPSSIGEVEGSEKSQSMPVNDPLPYKTIGKDQIFDVEGNLDIGTPRPDIDDKYKIGPWRKLTGEIFVSAEEAEKGFIQNVGNKLDYLLDRSYQKINGVLNIYHVDHNNPATPESQKSESSLLLQDAVESAKTVFEEFGMQDYAQEVFLKRSQQFDDREINLQELYQMYWG